MASICFPGCFSVAGVCLPLYLAMSLNGGGVVSFLFLRYSMVGWVMVPLSFSRIPPLLFNDFELRGVCFLCFSILILGSPLLSSGLFYAFYWVTLGFRMVSQPSSIGFSFVS